MMKGPTKVNTTTTNPTDQNSSPLPPTTFLPETPHDTFTTQPDNIPTDSTKQRPPPQTRTGTGTAERLNQVAEQNTVMMGQSKGKCPTKQSQSEAPSNNTKSPPLSVQSTSTPSQRTVQLRLHRVLNSASLSPLTVTPGRRRPSGTTDPKPRPNKTMFKRTRHDPTGYKVRDWTIRSIQPVVIIGD
ncbi:unnamed protein product [Arctogadus glacialis]